MVERSDRKLWVRLAPVAVVLFGQVSLHLRTFNDPYQKWKAKMKCISNAQLSYHVWNKRWERHLQCSKHLCAHFIRSAANTPGSYFLWDCKDPPNSDSGYHCLVVLLLLCVSLTGPWDIKIFGCSEYSVKMSKDALKFEIEWSMLSLLFPLDRGLKKHVKAY